MKFLNLVSCFGVLVSTLSISEMNSSEITLSLPSGEEAIIQIREDDTIFNILTKAEELLENDPSQDEFTYERNAIYIDLKTMKGSSIKDFQAAQGGIKNYQTKVTKKEKDDIAYIVTTLGRSSLKKIWDSESLIKKAGDRVDHLHPLKFVGTIFGDEELKVGLIQIKQRGGIVGRKFFNGIYDGLTKQANLQNVTKEMIIDFANNLNIASAPLIKVIEAKKWKEFISTLIDLLPRSGNPNRYDM